jgi:acyl dehydratase
LEGKAARVVAEAGGNHETMQARRVKRGLEWDTAIRILLNGVEEPVFEFTFTSLNAIPRNQLSMATYSRPSESSSPTWIDDPEPLVMTADGPNLYASLSRDYNPIHMSSILAKAFGFKHKIAHGNLVVALACQRAASGDSDPDLQRAKATFAALLNKKRGSTLHTSFRRPVFVPSTVYIRWDQDGSHAEVYEKVNGEIKVLVELHVQ